MYHYFVSYLIVAPDGLGAGMTAFESETPITNMEQLYNVRNELPVKAERGQPIILSYQLLRVEGLGE